MDAVCSECKKEFNILDEVIVSKEEVVDDGLIETIVTQCPQCGKHFVLQRQSQILFGFWEALL